MLASSLARLNSASAEYATRFVELVLAAARESGASDVHFQPTSQGLELAWRLDGVLQSLGRFPPGSTTDVVTRLKILAHLLTYRVDIPQEGRVRETAGGSEWRVSTFPTMHGERAVVRQVSQSRVVRKLDQLGLPPNVEAALERMLGQTSGAVIITGPAGSGKTTTAYACLRTLIERVDTRRSIMTLEDPIEAPLEGVAQSQIQPQAGFDLATGMRSVLRQDPEVILVGEIRDRETAEGVFNAALTGHLLFSTFHAGSAAGAITRLSDMGIEPYLLRSALLAVVHQRLFRRLCSCAQPGDSSRQNDREVTLGLPVESVWRPVGCEKCQQTGFRGRVALAELLLTAPDDLGRAILSRDDTPRLEALARESGLVPVREQAYAAISAGVTTPLEVLRVLGRAD